MTFNKHVQNFSFLMRHWRIILFAWTILIFIISFIGIKSSLNSQNIHPLLLVFTVLLPATFFLVLTLLTSLSFFSKAVLAIAQAIISFLPTKQTGLNTQSSPSSYFSEIFPAFSHYTWLIILIAIEISLLLSFTFESFKFYLGTTILDSYSLFEAIFNGLSFLPNVIANTDFDNQLILRTFEKKLTPADESLWSWWVIVMIFIYGIIPRLLLLIIYLFKFHYFSKNSKLKKIITSESTIIDQNSMPHLIMRTPKIIKNGLNDVSVAIDYLQPIPKNSKNVIILNEMNLYQNFLTDLVDHPLLNLNIFIDANLMPDRSILRKIVHLLDHAMNAEIILVSQFHESDELLAWHKFLTPLLQKNETLKNQYYESF